MSALKHAAGLGRAAAVIGWTASAQDVAVGAAESLAVDVAPAVAVK